MKLIGYMVGACLLLAVFRVAIVLVLLLMALSIVVGVVMRPRETLGFVAFFVIAGLAQSHGLALLCFVAVIVASISLRSWAISGVND